MSSILKMGTSKIDITPAFPVMLAGFSSRYEQGPFTGVTRPIHARIFAFKTDGAAHETQGVPNIALVVSADLLWWGSDRVPELKRRIRERWGIHEDAILFHGTHSHSGPQTSERFTSYLGAPDLRYIEDMETRVLDGIEIALGSIEPVRVERGSGQSPLGINRRGLQKKPPVKEPVDHELTVIRFVAERERTKAVLIHYACHPVITSENLVSSEYPGVATELLESALGAGALVGFLQSTCGDINPGNGERVTRGDAALVEQIGESFARDVQRVLEGPMSRLEACRLQWHCAVAALPLRRLPIREELEQGVSRPGVEGEWHRIQLARLDDLKPSLPLELTRLTLAEGLSLLAMNAEVVVEYGLYVKRLSEGKVLPLGYTNGMFGYIPTAKQIEEGGYEPQSSTIYFAMASPFDPAVEEVVKRVLADMV